MVLGQVHNYYSGFRLYNKIQQLLNNELLKSSRVVSFTRDGVPDSRLLVWNSSYHLYSLSILRLIRRQIQFEFVIARHPSATSALPRICRGLINKDQFSIGQPEVIELENKCLLHPQHLLFSLTTSNSIRGDNILDAIPDVPFTKTIRLDVDGLLAAVTVSLFIFTVQWTTKTFIDDDSSLSNTEGFPSP